MFDVDHWQEIWNALSRNKLRTFLTAFGVFWGLFMLIVMLGSGNGLRNGVTAGFAGGATNSFFVWSQRTSKPYRGLPPGRALALTNEDAEAIRRQIPEARVVAPRNQLGGFRGGENVTRGAKSGAFGVMGDIPAIRAIQAMRIVRGRFLNPLDLAERRKVAVIGTRVKELLFESGEDPIGQDVQIQGVAFRVIGVFESLQRGERGEQEAQSLFVPFTTFQGAFNFGNRVGWFAVTSADGVPASQVEAKVLALLRSRHRVAPDDERAFGHFNVEEEFNKVHGLFAGIRALIWIVGIGTLSAGVIGVSNIMLVIVRDRTQEIGIRRALGATPATIVGQIVLEAAVLTSAAGYLGLFAGTATLEVAAAALSGVRLEMFENPGVSLASAGQALAILVASGLLSGVLPARRAIRISPVEALRTY